CAFVRAKRPRTFPAVLCGDLNADPQSDEIRMLTGQAAVPVPGVVFRDAWTASGHYDEPGWTIDTTNPLVDAMLDHNRRIDYILSAQPKLGGVGHVLNAQIAGNKRVGLTWPSDHFAVVCEMRY